MLGPTEGSIISALIKGVTDIFVALIGRKKDKAAFSTTPAPIPLPPAVSPPPPAQPIEKPSTEKKPLPKPIVAITHSEIRARLELLAPVHRDLVEKSYVGMRVAWPVKFRSYDATEDRVMIHASATDTGSTIECFGPKDDFLCLVHAEENEVIEIEGTIEMASRAYVALADCSARRLAPA